MKLLDALFSRWKREQEGPIPTLRLAPELPHMAAAVDAQQRQALAELLLELHRAMQAMAFALGAQPSVHPERFQRDFLAAADAIWKAQGETPPIVQELLKRFEAGTTQHR